jgi:sialic acid synthase SpsE
MQIILDVGSGNTLTGIDVAKKMVDEIKAIDTGKHEIIFKTQLFENQPQNKPLDPHIFDWLYDYAAVNGYKCTSSVFDMCSLNMLLRYDIPFVKIACRPDLYWLIGEVPRKVPVYVSCEATPLGCWPDGIDDYQDNIFILECVPKYPARLFDYKGRKLISDHTVGLELLMLAVPHIWEKHLRLPETTGPDAGPFAILPSELKEIL